MLLLTLVIRLVDRIKKSTNRYGPFTRNDLYWTLGSGAFGSVFLAVEMTVGLEWLLVRVAIVGVALTGAYFLLRFIKGAYNSLLGNQSEAMSESEKHSQLKHARFAKAFIKLQNAWSAQNIDDVRLFMSDGLYERFSIQLKDMRQRKLVNKVDDLEIKSIKVKETHKEGRYESKTFEIKASALDVTLSTDTGKIIDESRATFVEFWTFTRSRDGEKKERNGLIEGHCPSCGAPLEMNQLAVCPACQCHIKNGRFDWVLTEITQDKVNVGSRKVSGIECLRRKDPFFSTQLLEDRASVIFWRLMVARQTKDTAAIRRVAKESALEALVNGVPMEKIAVGAVELTRIATDGHGHNLAQVTIHWSGVDVKTREVRSKKSTMFLLRSEEATSETTAEFGTSHCHSCGAPGEVGADDDCQYCGYVFNSIELEWLLIKFDRQGKLIQAKKSA